MQVLFSSQLAKAFYRCDNNGMQRSKRASSTDVARLAGVSQSAVSRAFTPGKAIAPATRAKVEAAAKALGYRPNMLARSLITRRTNIVAVMTGDISNPHYARTVNAMSIGFQRRGFHVLLFSLNQGNSVEESVEEVLKYRVDGVILITAALSSEVGEACAQVGVPVVLYNRYALHSNVSSVRIDNMRGGRDVADHLVGQGHTRIGFISGTAVDSTSGDRERGFAERLAELKAEAAIKVAGDFTFESGRLGFAKLWHDNAKVTAVFAASDIMAAGVMDAARHDFNLRIPDDLSVVGFDDIEVASWPSYDLTTIRQPVEQMTEFALDMLIERIDNGHALTQTRLICGELVARGSTGPNP